MSIQFAEQQGRHGPAISCSPTRRWRTPRSKSFFQSCVAGLLLACALSGAHAQLAPGSFTGWGFNENNQTASPAVVPALADVSAIAATLLNTIALRSDGTVVVWGLSNEATNVPQNLTDVIAVAATGRFMMALKRNGNLVRWGSSSSGRFVDESLTDVAAISGIYYRGLILKKDGTVLEYTTSSDLTVRAAAGSEIIAIAAGGFHGLGLRKDGTVVGWGSNNYGQITITPDPKKVVAIAASYTASFALREDGSISAWGDDASGLISQAPGSADIKAIAAGSNHGLALTTGGEVKAWGNNLFGPTDVPGSATGATAIAAGVYNSFALNALPLIRDKAYTFSGFQPPVNDFPVINIGKAGRSYPVKWQLKDQDGNFVSALTAVKSISLASVLCGTFGAAPADAIEIETTGETTLRYDTETNQFIYNWKTPRNPLCYMLFITLDTNEVLTAKFNLTK